MFRSRVREAINSAIRSTYGLQPGNVAHVNWLQKKCRYIYPHNFEVMFGCCQCKQVLISFAQRDQVSGDQPYALPIFAEGIRAAYFISPRSFGWRIVKDFTSSFPEKPEEKEIPAALLALVSTAVCNAYAHVLRMLGLILTYLHV